MTPTTIRKTLISAAVAAATLHAGQIAAAQIEEVIVTTQKREQSLQDIPLAVSAFSGSFMEKAQISDVKELALLTPGVSGDTDDSFLDSINVRGIATNDFGVGAEPSIGVYQNGIYLGRTGGALTSFFDVDMVEVVKGPQGTLFGRNASAGAFSITTKKPTDERGGSLDLGLGQYGYMEFGAAVNMPINENWSSRTAIYHQQQDGWVTNTNDGKKMGKNDATALRFSLSYNNDAVEADFVAEYEDRISSPTIYKAFDPDDTGFAYASGGTNERNTSSDVASDKLVDQGEVWGVSLNVEVDLGDDYTLTSITGIRGHNYYYFEDFDGSDLPIFNYNQIQDQTYYSQEFRLNKETEAVSWFVGASWYKEELNTRFNQTFDEDTMCATLGVYYAAAYAAEQGDSFDVADFESQVTDCPSYYSYLGYADYGPGIGERNDSVDIDAEYDGWGIYGDAIWHATEALDITLGARYTEDSREFGQLFGGQDRNYYFYSFPFYTSDFARDSHTWSNTSVRAAVNYQLSDDVSVYGSYSTGYKAGGYSILSLTFPDGVTDEDLDGADALDFGGKPKSFDKEEVTSIELGMKGQFWDDQMQLNASVYSYSFDGMQSGYYEGAIYGVANVGDAEGTGVELDARVLPTDNLDIYLGVAWADTELTNPADVFCDPADCKGAQIPGTIGFSGAMVATYRLPVASGEMAVSVEVFHQGSSPGFGQFSNDPLKLDGFTTSNLRIGYESSEDWTATFWVNNITDEFYYKGVAGAGSNIAAHHFGFSEPRRIGFDIGWKF